MLVNDCCLRGECIKLRMYYNDFMFQLLVVYCCVQEEFLLNSPSALGIFATSAGNSNRPPITWSVNLISVGYAHPYILAMDDEFITVHR